MSDEQPEQVSRFKQIPVVCHSLAPGSSCTCPSRILKRNTWTTSLPPPLAQPSYAAYEINKELSMNNINIPKCCLFNYNVKMYILESIVHAESQMYKLRKSFCNPSKKQWIDSPVDFKVEFKHR